MNKILREKVQEALSSVLPITLIVLVLSMTITPMPVGTLVLFLAGAVLLIVGMAFFSLGTDVSMTPMGEGIGAQLPKTKNLAVVIAITLLIGILITIAEPDLQVLAGQVPSIPNSMLIWTVAVGVGLFFVLALLRTIFKIRLSLLLILFYIAVFIFSAFVPNEFVSVAFDSGGVTTGPITVPFIMALGVGLASIRGDSGAQDDSFGLVALCSIGPVLAVLLLGIFYSGGDAGYTQIAVPELEDTRQVAAEFVHALPDYIREVVSALLPVIAFCAIFQLIFKRFHKIQLQKIGIGFLYTFVGLALFLTGVNVGFMPVGNYIGKLIGSKSFNWILAGRSLSRTAVCIERQKLDLNSARYAHRLLPRHCRAGGACAQPTGRNDYKRRYLAARDDAQPVDRCGVLGGTGDAARAHGHLYLLHLDSGLLDRAHADVFCAEDIHRHCVRLGRRRVRPDDNDLPAALLDGRLRSARRERADRCLRHRGDGCHDAAADDTDARSALPLQTERYAAGYARCGR